MGNKKFTAEEEQYINSKVEEYKKEQRQKEIDAEINRRIEAIQQNEEKW